MRFGGGGDDAHVAPFGLHEDGRFGGAETSADVVDPLARYFRPGLEKRGALDLYAHRCV